jgi:predicted aspartyl protease
MKKIYKLEKQGSLLATRCFIEGKKGKAYPNLLVDTGSAFTIISQELLEFVGSSPVTAPKRRRIITGSGYEIVPVVSVPAFHCLGKTLKNYPIYGHTLPIGIFVDGLLGMDFLRRFDILMDLKKGEIEIETG